MLAPISGAAPPADSGTVRPRNVEEAATQFEALLISQMLKSSHEEGESWLGTGDDQTASTMTGLAEEHLSQTLATHGGLGLSKVIVQQLHATAPTPPSVE
jgi:Rod binding domain-containing protein